MRSVCIPIRVLVRFVPLVGKFEYTIEDFRQRRWAGICFWEGFRCWPMRIAVAVIETRSALSSGGKSNALRTSFDNAERPLAGRERHVVGHHRL